MTGSKLVASGQIDFTGFSDYYSGHGHSFAKDNLVACIRLGILIDGSLTVADFKECIEDDINGWDLDIIKDSEGLEDQIREIDFKAVIAAMVKKGVKDSDLMFPELSTDYEDIHPSALGYVHIHKET